jgi:hypothetical protein
MSTPDDTNETCDDALDRTGLTYPWTTNPCDLETMFRRYRNGTQVSAIARDLQKSFDWVAQQVIAHGVRREVPVKRSRRGSFRPELEDPHWIRQQLAEGADVRAISEQLNVGTARVRQAIKGFGITPPTSRPHANHDAGSRSDPGGCC